MNRIFVGLSAFVLWSSSACAADLAAIDRHILKEPAYRNQPKYCLLVFGPEAKTRVWLVQDGDTLYADRNGNGDLTEAGKKVVSEKWDGQDEGVYSFKLGQFRVGSLLHKEFVVHVSKLDHLDDQDADIKAFLAKNPKGRSFGVSVEMEMPGWKGTGIGGRVRQHTFYADVNGILQFADKPQDAPIIHCGGPRQILLWGQHTLTINRETDMILGVGTPGIGPGTTAWIDYEGVIPDKLHPTVEVTFPPKSPGESPVRERYELTHRC